MARRLGYFAILSLLLIALAPAVSFAQQSGSLFVKAVDQQGAALPGATVAISSPVMPQEVTGTTDSTGSYRYPLAAVGTYKIKVSLTGFQTVIREGVIVLQGQTAVIEVPLKIGAMTSEVTVKGAAPTVDTKSANIKVNLDKDLLETTPGGKDIWNIIEYKAPGVVFATPDVGGNQAGLQRAFTSRGTPNAQNTQMLNGVTVNDPAAQGFSMNYYDPSAFENIQVSNGAQDISVGTAGVFVNMISKSGSNRFNGQALFTCQGNCGPAKTQWKNIDTPLYNAGFRPDSNAVDYVTNTNFQAGGPMIKNRLFYFGSLNFQPTHVFVPGFPAVVPPYMTTQLSGTSIEDTTDILTGTGKFNYQLNSNNRFEFYLQKQRYDKPNRGASAGVTQDSNTKELDVDNTAQAAWNLVLTDRLFSETRLSYNNVHFPLTQKTDMQSISDSFAGVRYRNAANSAVMFRRRLEFVSNWQYYTPKLLGGRHEFKGGIDNGYTPETVDTSRIDNVNDTFSTSTGVPKATTITIFNSPIQVRRAVMSTALFGQDSYSYQRLTAIGGIRWERIEGYLPAQQNPTGQQYFPAGQVFNAVSIGGVTQSYTIPASYAAVREDPLWHNWAPRGSATYDLTGKGRTVLKFSVGKYLDQISTGTPPNPNGTISQTYNWNDTNGDLLFQPGAATWNGTQYVGGEFGTLTATTIPNPAPFDKTLRRPYRNEMVVGVDHELFPNILASLSYIYRREHDITGTVDQSMDQWGTIYSPITLQDPGRDGVSNTADDQSITVYNLNKVNGVLPTITSTTVNDDRLAAHYKGVEFTVNKRYSNGWTMLGAYTYSHTRQDLISLSNPNNVYVNAKGEVDGANAGRRHNIKFSGSYTLKYQIVVGGNFRLASGLPITRTWAISACSATILTNCTNQAVTVNAEPRGSVELPWLPTADIRVGRFFKFGSNRVEASIDVYNLTNANTTYSVRTSTGLSSIRVGGDPAAPVTLIPSFLSPTGVLGPRILRFNITWQFGTK